MANPNEEILRALNHLEAYTEMASRNVSRFEEIKDRLQALFFSEYRKEKTRQNQSEQKELVRSVGLIKKYLPLIERYRHGSKKERRFAKKITDTIQRYNKIASLPIDETHHIAYKKSGDKETALIESVFRAKTLPGKAPSQLEKDTLKMKAIRMIEDNPIFQESLLETLKLADVGDAEEIENDGKMVKLMQTWSELPGEVHRIVGSFRRESERSIPIKDSFKVFMESKQTGHPYPSQHTGWALSHWLVPTTALWIDNIPLLQPIALRKKLLATALLPGGERNLKARSLYRLKKRLFEEGRLEFLTFHQELSRAITAASSDDEDIEAFAIINHFFETLIQEPDPFTELSRVNEELNRIFIDIPFEAIEELRLNGTSQDIFQALDTEREATYRVWESSTPDKTLYDKAKKGYLNLTGRIMGNAAALLLKLHLSEKLGVKPPPLSDFEMKVQAAAFKHLLEFLDEMEEPSALEDPHEQAALKLRMKMEIQSEIELFTAASFEEIDPFLQELTEEAIGYFHERYYSG